MAIAHAADAVIPGQAAGLSPEPMTTTVETGPRTAPFSHSMYASMFTGSGLAPAGRPGMTAYMSITAGAPC
jgi:hypothetical protein